MTENFDNTGAELTRAMSNLRLDGGAGGEVASADFSTTKHALVFQHGDGTVEYRQGGALQATVKSDGGEVFDWMRHPPTTAQSR